jgi:hypothetical protein
MGNKRKLIGAVAFSAALAGGGVAGAVLGVPSISSAQTPSSASDSSSATPRPERGPKGGPQLDAAASALGITADELRTQLESGKTIAQVASDRGVNVQTVIDAVTADENAEIDAALAAGKITQAQADEMKANAAQHAADIVNGVRPPKGAPRPAD